MLLHVTFKIKIQLWEGEYFAARNQQFPASKFWKKVMQGRVLEMERLGSQLLTGKRIRKWVQNNTQKVGDWN